MEKNKKLIQLIDDELVGLFELNTSLSKNYIQNLYKEYNTTGFDDFEEFMEVKYPLILCTRLFVDEIYV